MRLHSVLQRSLIAITLTVGVLLEYTNVPPWHYVKLLPVPKVYAWLASLGQEQAGIVVQYPLQAAYLPHTPFYAFYDYAVYHLPLFNGVPTATPPDYLRGNLEDILNPTTPAALAALGIRTAVLDMTYYAPYYREAHLHWNSSPTPFFNQLPVGFALQFKDIEAAGYRITALPAHVLAGGAKGFGHATLQQDGRLWRWLSTENSLWLYNPTSTSARVAVWTLVHNNAREHLLVWQNFVPIPISIARYSTPVALPATIAPGFHRYTLSIEGVRQPVQGGNDPRSVTVQVRSLEPEPVHPLVVPFLEHGQTTWQLTGFSLDACAIQAGQPLDVALFWRAQQQTSTNLTVFLHVLNAAGQLVAQGDGPPDSGQISTTTASPGARIIDIHTIQLPTMIPPGTYRLTAGLYNRRTGVRLARADGATKIELGTVQVMPRASGPRRMACPW